MKLECITDPQEILVVRLYSLAHAYHETCTFLEKSLPIVPNARMVLNSLLTFSIELSLKTILAMEGSSEDQLKQLGHSIEILYKKIDTDDLSQIAYAFENAYKAKMKKSIDFKKILSECSDNFGKWRYLTQVDNLNNLEQYDTKDNFEFLCNLERVTYEICEAIHNLYLNARRASGNRSVESLKIFDKANHRN